MGDASALRALRVFRALRAVKAVKHLAAIQNIITVFEDASEEYFMFISLLFLCIFIFVLTGMQVFSGMYGDGEDCATTYEVTEDFNSFYSSFVLIFRALTLDDWNTVAFGGVQCAGKVKNCEEARLREIDVCFWEFCNDEFYSNSSLRSSTRRRTG